MWVKEHRADHCPPSLPPKVKGACMASRRLILTKQGATHPGNGRIFDGHWWDQNSPYMPRCFAIADGWDAMERSVTGGGCRPSFHAAMYGEATATASMLRAITGRREAAHRSRREDTSGEADEDGTRRRTMAPGSGGGGGGGGGRGDRTDKRRRERGQLARLRHLAKEFEVVAEQIRSDFLATYWNQRIGFFATYKLPGSSWCQARDEAKMVPGEKGDLCRLLPRLLAPAARWYYDFPALTTLRAPFPTVQCRL